jgi:hypothetical protein
MKLAICIVLKQPFTLIMATARRLISVAILLCLKYELMNNIMDKSKKDKSKLLFVNSF